VTGVPDFLQFLAATTAIAVSPGPGIFYVAARTLAGAAKAWRRAWEPGSAAWSMSWPAQAACRP
jgi:threonine/homoserine/homoserine lactone efflux protein